MVSEQEETTKGILRYNDITLCIMCADRIIFDGDDNLLCPKNFEPVAEKERECPVIAKMLHDSKLEQCSHCDCLEGDRYDDIFYPVCEVRTCTEWEKLEKVSEKQAELIK